MLKDKAILRSESLTPEIDKDELISRIKNLVPSNAFIGIGSVEHGKPSEELRFKCLSLEVNLWADPIPKRQEAFDIYNRLKKAIPEAQESVFKESMNFEWEYSLVFNFIGKWLLIDADTELEYEITPF